MIRSAPTALHDRHFVPETSGPFTVHDLNSRRGAADSTPMADINDLIIDGHLAELRRRNLSPGTIEIRRRSAQRMAAWMSPRTLADTTPDDIDAFLDSRPFSPRTRYAWCSNLHRLFDYAVRYELIERDPTSRVIRPKIDRLLPRPIADDDLADALEQTASRTMRAWLLLASMAGLRVAEIAQLDRVDVVEADMMLRILGKGRKERIVPLHNDVLAAMRGCGIPRTGPVFVRPDGRAYTPPMVSQQISWYLTSIGVDATAHQLRHWFGTKTYRGCRDIRTVQELLGHSSPATTAIYTAISPERARAAVDALAMPA